MALYRRIPRCQLQPLAPCPTYPISPICKVTLPILPARHRSYSSSIMVASNFSSQKIQSTRLRMDSNFPHFDMLCDMCQRMFCGHGLRPSNALPWREGRTLKRLHHTIHNLIASAENGCHLCNLIVGSLNKDLMEDEMEASSGPLYVKLQSKCFKGALDLSIYGSQFTKYP
jgi:hypothetical protein